MLKINKKIMIQIPNFFSAMCFSAMQTSILYNMQNNRYGRVLPCKIEVLPFFLLRP